MKAAPTISFEFFPPNTPAGFEKLRSVREALARFAPAFYSVTYGAGGVTRDKTLSVVNEIAGEGRTVAPHLSCIGASRDSVRELLALYRRLGIRRLVLLRGDLPSGMRAGGDFLHASDLVSFVRSEAGDLFHLEVAAYPEMHPQARTPRDDLQAFAAKMRAGADSAITQYFFNADAYLRFRDAAARIGIDAPIVPGIMPISNFSQLARFSDSCGAEIPRWIRLELAACGDDLEAIREFGAEVVGAMCRRLLAEGAPGLHFYTLNQAGPTTAIVEALGAAH
ncbi:MAG: methylenetetrahydrofolate reductase [NAD(P)H] [Burkholderiaceae bacterium]|nr:methylenetetrahydrofolate reductase [NAD(P)H] [Burkholderiaceae bacterium]